MSRPTEHDLREARFLCADGLDDELLAAMGNKHVDLAVATAALEEFIRRHRLYVYRMCSNLVDRYGTASGWTHEQFAEQVFAEQVFVDHHQVFAEHQLFPEYQVLPEQQGFTTEDVLWALGIWSVILCFSPVIVFYMLMVA